MRTRSSRFFVILLHLLGVSNHYPNPSAYYDWAITTASGIVGVHPYSIVLERVDLQRAGGLDRVEWFAERKEKSSEPFWLQDSIDGRCLGPSGGFSECGDATLWYIQRRERKRRIRMGLFGVEEERRHELEPYGYAFEVADMNFEQDEGQIQQQKQVNPRMWGFKRLQVSSSKQDCLVASKRSRDETSSTRGSLSLNTCSARKKVWSWRVDEDGVLYEVADDNKRSDDRRCLWRYDDSKAALDDCTEGFLDEDSLEPRRLVQFTLVRYRVTSVPATEAGVDVDDLSDESNTSLINRTGERISVERSTLKTKQEDNENADEPALSSAVKNTSLRGASSVLKQLTGEDIKKDPLPKAAADIAHSHASDPVSHPELKLGPRPVLTASDKKAGKKSATFAVLKDTNPILLFGSQKSQSADTSQSTSPLLSSSSGMQSPTTPSLQVLQQKNNDASYKLRRMEIHPYIAAAKDEIWVDPLTGLDYRTDLCQYLGHERKESGRHTLMGVGQYVRTVLKVKVYGIALYVSKRDSLADPVLEKYSSVSSEELRNRPDFYANLRHLSSPADPNNGIMVDRTLLLKLNMQLSIDTMRSSLDADWKLLTDEAKKLLIGASLQSNPADENMLKRIESSDNPSRCSCSQIAPEEYEADPTCCARGTELVFTWRKNGDLEVRLDGRLMDSFPRPDVAEGIFYEYLRIDDPMSIDFIERVVDGFPFLLAPLAQVKGVSSSALNSQQQQQQQKHSNNHANGLKEAWESFAGSISAQSGELASNIQSGASDLAEHAVNTVRSMGDAAKQFSEEMDRRRDSFFKHVQSNLPLANVMAGQGKYALVHISVESDSNDEISSRKKRKQAPRGRVFRYPLSRWLGESYQAPDEIGPMIHPTMNMTRKVFLALVHLYLLLLLIVSFPGSYHTRTKVRKNSSKSFLLDSDSETSDSGYTTRSSSPASSHGDDDDHVNFWYHKNTSSKFDVNQQNNQHRHRYPNSRRYIQNNEDIFLSSQGENPPKMKKSLSYFL